MTAVTHAGGHPLPFQERARTIPLLLAATAVLVAFCVLAGLYAARVPLGHPMDETSHLGYARLLADHMALPGADVPEKQQPPLFYLLAGGLLRIGVAPRGIRAIDVGLGAATLVVLMLAVRRLVPSRPWIAIASGALVAGLPAFQIGAGAITDDALSWLVGAVVIGLTIEVLRGAAPSAGMAAAVGAAIGMALLTKETDWPLAAVLAGSGLWAWRGSWTARAAALACGLPVAIAGWWFARNVATFHDLLPPLRPLSPSTQLLRRLDQISPSVAEAVKNLFGPQGATGGPLPRAEWLSLLSWAGAGLLCLLLAGAAVRVAERWRSLPMRDRALVLALGGGGALVAIVIVLNSVFIDLQPRLATA